MTAYRTLPSLRDLDGRHWMVGEPLADIEAQALLHPGWTVAEIEVER